MRTATFRGILAGLGAVITVSAFGQAPKATEEQRLDSILYAVHLRTMADVDYWYDRGDFPRCIQLLRVHTTIFPEDYDAVRDLGLLLESTEQKAAALAAYIAYRRNNPSDPDGGLLEAFFYMRMKTYAKVPPLLEPYINRQPHPNVYRQLAHAYEKLEMLTDAQRVWKALIEAAPNEPGVQVNLNRVEKQLHNAGPTEGA